MEPIAIPSEATCEICKQPVGMGKVYRVEAIADDNDEPLPEPHIVKWFHKECLDSQ